MSIKELAKLDTLISIKGGVLTLGNGETYDLGRLVGVIESAKADLEGILPEFDPSGDRDHPAWLTLDELNSL